VGFAFGAFEVDKQLYELRQGGVPVRVDRKVFDLLCYLIEHRDRVVDKEELLAEVWSGDSVVEAVVPTAITRLRKTLSQVGNATGPIQTVHGRGYRFSEEVTMTPDARSDRASAKTSPRPESSPSREQALRSSIATARAMLDTDLRPSVRDPFVGRDEVMARLTASLDRALEGQLRGRLLVGEPGIGKTRVTTELANLARRRGARVWTGRCQPLDEPILLWPWQQIARHASSTRDLEILRALKAPERNALAPMMPDLRDQRVDPPLVLTDRERLSLMAATCAWLRASAAQGPMVLVFDDLHWSDTTSLELLEHVLVELGEAPILILATYRHAELPKGHAHAALLDRMERAACWKRIALGSLSLEDVERYLQELTGNAAPAPLVARLHERTGGNPFFVRETVRTLTQGELTRARATYSDIELPGAARDVMRRRIAVLPASAQRMLDAASILGVSFESSIVAAMLETTLDALLDDLDRAVAAELIELRLKNGNVVPSKVSASFVHAFCHALVRDTLYGDLSSRMRRSLHRAAARALQERGRSEDADAIAQHVAQGGDASSSGGA
jgi:predicted ATPase/DNA-binding winged helix-turn-helix (wHTH) protein